MKFSVILKNCLAFVFFLFVSLIFFRQTVSAAGNCSGADFYPSPLTTDSSGLFYFFHLTQQNAANISGQFIVQADRGTSNFFQKNYLSDSSLTFSQDSDGTYRVAGQIVKSSSPRQFGLGTHTLTLFRKSDNPNFNPGDPDNTLTTPYCDQIISYSIEPAPTSGPGQIPCTLVPPDNNLSVDDPISIGMTIPVTLNTGSVFITLTGTLSVRDANNLEYYHGSTDSLDNFTAGTTIPHSIGTIPNPGQVTAIYDITSVDCQNDFECHNPINQSNGECKLIINIAPSGQKGSVVALTPTPATTAVPTPLYGQPTLVITKVQPLPTLQPLCDTIANKNSPDENMRKLWGSCDACIHNGEIWSAIGCVPTDFSKIISKYIFGTGVGIAGGIAFLYFIYGSFLILTSSGNPEKIEEARQIITSAISGLLLIIFSVFLLHVIGVDILKLPGFN